MSPALVALQEHDPPRGWRVAQVARATGIPRSSLYAAIKRGDLAVIRFSASGFVILEDDLRAFLERNRTGGAA